MDVSSGHMDVAGRVSLLVAFALACSAAQAQRPKAPVLMTANAPGSSTIIHRETFSGFNTGTYYQLPGVWNTGSSVRNGLCSFQDSNPPVAGGGKYLRCGPVAKDAGNVFRTEYWYVGRPSFQAPTDLGNGHNVSPTYWYGHNFCLDQYPQGGSGEGGGRAHFNQFHDVDDGEHSPKVSLYGNGQELRVYMEHNMEASPDQYGRLYRRQHHFPGAVHRPSRQLHQRHLAGEVGHAGFGCESVFHNGRLDGLDSAVAWVELDPGVRVGQPHDPAPDGPSCGRRRLRRPVLQYRRLSLMLALRSI